MGLLLKFVVGFAVLAGLFSLFLLYKPPGEWRVQIEGKRPRAVRGRVPGRFLVECESICAEWGIEKGKIDGVRNVDGRVSLRFSKEISPEHHQRFRNAWGTCS